MESNANATAFYDVRDVKSAANGRWPDVLARLGIDPSLLRNSHGPCPGCGGKNRFRFDDVGGDGSFLCSQGTGQIIAGDGIALLMHCKPGWEWKTAVQELGAVMGIQPSRGRMPERPRDPSQAGVAPEPRAEKNKRPEIDAASLWEFTQGMPGVDEAWFSRRSPVDVSACDTREFLRLIYREDERVLVFVNEHSQGDFIARMPPPSELIGGDAKVRTYRLSQTRGVKAVESALPTGGPKGVWFLTNPVAGTWAINPRARNKENESEPQWSRRSMESITSWRFFVLESDVLPLPDWLRVVANLQLPIAALYTSGGRSIHCLVQIEVPTKAHWDAARDVMREAICPLGADPGALSAVRLSRLPGCTRGLGAEAKLQRLIYLNPNPDQVPIRLRKELRP